MEQSELVWLATYAVGKGLSYEKLKYCDYLYGKEEFADDVWEYVEEYESIGSIAFREKYKQFKLY